MAAGGEGACPLIDINVESRVAPKVTVEFSSM